MDVELIRVPEVRMASNFVEATRELCDDLDNLVEAAKQSRAPIRALSLIERASADLHAYLEEMDQRPTGPFLRKL
jgi:hypothetical protein